MTTESPQPVSPARDDAAGGSFFDRSYRAFISYSHTDSAWANWLIRRLEGYRVPERFQGRTAPIGEVGARIAPVFRDRDELPTADDLGDAVQDALRRSATLIVICSPAAARSRWVNEEAMVFKRLGRGNRVFALIVGGEPGAKDPAQECFPPALRFSVGSAGALSDNPVELIAADAREHADGKEDAFIRLVAGLLGVGFDDVRQRELQRRQRRLMRIAAGSTAVAAVTIALAVIAWVRSEDAKRRLEGQEQLMTRLLDGLDARIKRAERLDELDGEIESAMAYFRSLNPRDLTDAMLAKQAKGLTQMGEVRAKQLRLAEADTALAAAIDRLTVLTQRHPKDGAMLFERAQAEFWIGNQHRRRGNLVRAGEWLARYRDSGAALAALDPRNLKWQQEAISSLGNLAVLELDRGNYAIAEEALTRTLAARRSLAAELPGDRQWDWGISNNVSFLGTVAERRGEFTTARARFEEHGRLIGALMAKEPTNPRWRERFANGLALESDLDQVGGQRAVALEKLGRACAMLQPLVEKDPTNRVWLLTLLRIELRMVPLQRASGDTAEARRMLSDGMARLGKLDESAFAEIGAAKVRAAFWRAEAAHRAALGEAGATEAAQKAMASGEELVANETGNVETLIDHLCGCVTAGQIAAQQGDTAAARRHWERGVTLAGSRVRESRYWALLDPMARALALLGRSEESRLLIERLHGLGYQPLEPWPSSAQ